MHRRFHFHPPILVLLFAFFISANDVSATQRALLVGVTQYDYLPEDRQLQGSANDAWLIYQLLKKQGFENDDIRILCEPSKRLPHVQRPTRDNIIEHLEKMMKISSPGDQVVLFLAGHGSRQPANEDPFDPEPDECDELFLPADVRQYNHVLGTVENAITDDEIGSYLRKLTAADVSVWFIADFCHSGTAARDVDTGFTNRFVHPKTLGILGLPAPQFRQEETSFHVQSSYSKSSTVPDHAPWIATYASLPSQRTPERKFSSKSGVVHGLFTYHLVKAIDALNENLTYRKLTNQIRTYYEALDLDTPTPATEGYGLDQLVFSQPASLQDAWSPTVQKQKTQAQHLFQFTQALPEASVSIEVKIHPQTSKQSISIAHQDPTEPLGLKVDQIISLRATNHHDREIALYLFYFDSATGITSLLDSPEIGSLLKPASFLETSRFRVSAAQDPIERIVALAVEPSDSSPNPDLSEWVQAPLDYTQPEWHEGRLNSKSITDKRLSLFGKTLTVKIEP